LGLGRQAVNGLIREVERDQRHSPISEAFSYKWDPAPRVAFLFLNKSAMHRLIYIQYADFPKDVQIFGKLRE
jgi:hypothetical protein